jgi:hypothetical protein
MRASQPETHPDADLLAAFAEQALPDRERRPLLEHLSICSACREVLALAAVPAKSPAFTTKDTADARKAPWFTWSVLRWGAAAACVVVVGTAVLLTYNERAFSPKQSEAPAPFALESPAAAPAPQPPAVSEQREEESATRPARQAVTLDELKKQATPRRDASVEKDTRVLHYAYDPSSETASGTAGKQLTNELRATQAKGAFVAGNVATGGAPALLPPVPAPAKPLQTPSNKEMQNLPLKGRAYSQYAEFSSGPVASIEVQSPLQQAQAQSPQVQAQLVDGPASADSDKKVEILGRAKSPPSSTSNALAVAPTDQLDRLQTNSPATPEAAAKAKRRVFSHSESTRWNLSSDGQLQRSIDSGKTWQPVAAPPGAAFRALSYNGPDIWVGGAAGLLYHSPDAGTRWDLVKPSANGSSLSADIAAIAFTDPQHGKITTSNGETWTTADGGQSWNESH